MLGITVLGPSWVCPGLDAMAAQTAGELESFAWALQGRCGQSCWRPPGCRGQQGQGRASAVGCRAQLGTGLAARAGAQEAVNTAEKFSFKAWNDLWVITGCDRVSCQAWVIWGWGVREDNGDKLGPEGMCTVRSRGRRGGRGGAAFSSVPRHNLLSLS